jgi:hypothetical protein
MKRVLINLLAVCLAIGPLGLVVTPPTPVLVASVTVYQADAPVVA